MLRRDLIINKNKRKKGSPIFVVLSPGFLYQKIRKKKGILIFLILVDREKSLDSRDIMISMENGFFSRGFNLSMYARPN